LSNFGCRLKVAIHGINVSQDRINCIEQYNLAERCLGSDTLELSVRDPEFKYISDNIFVKDSPISATVTWDGSFIHAKKFTGFIHAVDINFPNEGFPRLTLTCLDSGSYRMHQTPKTREFKAKTTADVIREVAREYGYKVSIESGYNFVLREFIGQTRETDLEFCERLPELEREPFFFKVKDNTVYYKRLGIVAKEKVTINYKSKGCEVISFNPQITKKFFDDTPPMQDITPEKEIGGEEPIIEESPVNIPQFYQYDPKRGIWTLIDPNVITKDYSNDLLQRGSIIIERQ
jgi:hypothetical protein